MSGVIKGKGDGKWGRITINRDGSMLLENVTLEGIAIQNCDIYAQSGEYPIRRKRATSLRSFLPSGTNSTP
jgi:ribosomal protein L24